MASAREIANAIVDGVKEVILAVVGAVYQRGLMATSVTGQMIILVQVESAGAVTTAQIHMVSCLRITTVAQIPTAAPVSIAMVVLVTGDLVGREHVGEKSLMGTGTEGQMLLADLVVEIVIFVDVAMFLRAGNVPRIQTANAEIAQLVGVVLNGAAEGVANIRKRDNEHLFSQSFTLL